MTKEELIQQTTEIMRKMYLEDIEFFHGFIIRYANKKGIKIAAPGAANIQSGKVESD